MIGDEAGANAAENSGDTEQHTPVAINETLGITDCARVWAKPFHDRLAQKTRTELDGDDDPDDPLREHAPCDFHRAQRALLPGRCVAGVEIYKPRLRRRIGDDDP